MAEEQAGRDGLETRLQAVDAGLAGLALDDGAFAALDLEGLHRVHGIAGRVQDRVTAILTRLTMEMVSREDGGVGGKDPASAG